ncbi:MAG: hypothetical protein SO016_11430 [Lachnospiraceae bacterium]|nr:hypothetical protein [Robinsoniella sp.]MDY3767276.1 hypothetical protein [Lachnospiraceae bacterium]
MKNNQLQIDAFSSGLLQEKRGMKPMVCFQKSFIRLFFCGGPSFFSSTKIKILFLYNHWHLGRGCDKVKKKTAIVLEGCSKEKTTCVLSAKKEGKSHRRDDSCKNRDRK